MRFTKLILLFCFCLIYSAVAGKNDSYHTFVINYNRAEYLAMSQNWAVEFDDIGRVYFGNSGGVLEFDGNRWILHEHKSKSAIRALYFDAASKKLFSGCYEDFGFWERDESGILKYQSLKDKLDGYQFHAERIWSIEKVGDEILFQSFPSLFVYNTSSKEVKYIDPKGELLFLGKVNGDVYTRVRGKGICKYKNSGFELVEGSDFAKNAVIRFFLPHPKGIIVGDGKTGLYILENGALKKWDCEANNQLSEKDVNAAAMIDSNTYAIGTLKGGLYIIDSKGNILNHLDRQSKLSNNTVLGINIDHAGDIWLGMDNGISYVDLNPDVEFKIDFDHAPSAIYSVVLHNGYLYVGTNNGVLFSKFNKSLADIDFKDLKPLEGISGHIWKLGVLNGELLCGSNDGIYELENGKSNPISLTGGGTDYVRVQLGGTDYLLESTYYKIRVLRRENDRWVFSHLVDGFEGSCQFIELDHSGYLWLSHEIKGLNRLKLSTDLKTVVSIKSFGLNEGLPTGYGLNVFSVNNRVVVTTGEEIYTYDDLSDQMLPYNKLNKSLGRFKKAIRIVNVDASHFWAITSNEAAFVQSLADTIQIRQTLSLNNQFSFPDKYQNISINGSQSVLCLENGIAVWEKNQIDTTIHLPLVISSIFNRERGHAGKGKYLPLITDEPIELKPRNNSVEFSLTSVNFGPNEVNYQYRIKNLIPDWQIEGANYLHAINDIPAGEYVYQAKAVFSDGTVSNMVEYAFVVRPQWYASRIGVVAIILVLVGMVSILIIYNKRILEKQTSEIEQKHKDQHKQNESTIERLKNDVLQKELENLQGKLTVSANALVEKDKSINTIKTELESVYEKLEGRFPHRDFKKILQVINSQLTQKKDMLDFEQHFKASQSGFYDKLREEYPMLTPADLRLCSLLKMNMNSKEISVLLGITVRSVEVSRYRLRRKMGLSPEENLTKTIMQI